MKAVASKTGVQVVYTCSVHLLNNAIITLEYTSDDSGQDVMNNVCKCINLKFSEIWGLKYIDAFEQRHWLDLSKSIRRQVKEVSPLHFELRLKFYPLEPYRIEDGEARDLIFIQLRYDLASGRLGCGLSNAPLLMGLVLQYTYGDYNSKIHVGNYIKEKIIMNQSFIAEMKAMDLHKKHLKGLTRDQAQDLFFRLSSELETYGVDPYLVEDAKKDSVTLWINHQGIATYRDTKNVDYFDWSTIRKISNKGRKLLICLLTNDIVTYQCLTNGECDYICESAASHLSYFAKWTPASGDRVDDDEKSEKFINKIHAKKIKIDKAPACCSFYQFFVCQYVVFLVVFFCVVVRLFDYYNYDLLLYLKNFVVNSRKWNNMTLT